MKEKEGEEEKGWEEEEEGIGHSTVYKIDDVSNKDLPSGRGDSSQHSVLIYMGSSDRVKVAQLCPTPCDPVDCSIPGLPVHRQLPESTQTHVHQVGDAIQPSHPLSSPSPPALNLSQHQGLFQ